MLLLTVSAASAGENEEYKLIAVTTSIDSANGPNFEFTNIPDGDYILLMHAPMGSTSWVDMINFTVSGNDVSGIETNAFRYNNSTLLTNIDDIRKEIEVLEEEERESGYTVEGTANRNSVRRHSATMYLLQNTIIGDTVFEKSGNDYTITITAFAADNVSIKYTNSTGDSVEIKNSTPFDNSFEFKIPENELNYGYTVVSVTAEGKNGIAADELTLRNSDPAKEGIPRKIVVLTGYESNSKSLNELKQTYAENGSNVDLIILTSKNIDSMTSGELYENISDADIIFIYMISTTPTWMKVSSAIDAAIADGDAFLYDSNATRMKTLYGDYEVPSVIGVSDNASNLEAYQTKLQKYWTSSPYDGTNLEYLFNLMLCDFFGRYDLNPPGDVISLPTRAIYHPHMETLFENSYEEYIKWYETNTEIWEGEDAPYTYDPNKPTVGITFYSAYYPTKMAPIDKLILELEKSGINVIASYTVNGSNYDADALGGKYFIAGEIDAVLNYRYMGGHLFTPADLDVPVFNILNLDMTSEEWENTSNPLGNNTIKTLNQELIGAIDPIVIVTEDWIDGELLGWPIDGQVEYLVGRVAGQLNLQIENNHDKNVALVYYNHGGGKASIGASYLDVPESIVEIMSAMKSDDYNVNMSKIPDSEAIVESMLAQGINIGTWAPGELKEMIGDADVSDGKEIYDTGKAVLISKELYLKWFEEAFLGEWFEDSIKTLTDEEKAEKRESQRALYESKLEEIEELWGTAPGNIMVYEDNYIVIPYIDVSDTAYGGRVILTPQPARGHATSIETLYHDTNIAPTHQYAAFYLWLQHNNGITLPTAGESGEEGNEESGDGDVETYPENEKNKRFEADAIIHLGRHGTHEWLPGKELALSRYDWPALLAGEVPIIYPYIVDGVGEGIVAKRRGNAVLIDHMTPAIVYAGLYGDFEKLSSSILSYGATTGETSAAHKETIISYLNTTGFDERLGVTEEEVREMSEEDFEEILHEIEEYLEAMKSTFMPYGLHVYGVALEGEPLAEMVLSMLGDEFIQNVTAVNGATSDDALSMLKDVILNGESTETAVNNAFAGKPAQPSSDQKTNIINGLTLGETYAKNLVASARETDQLLKALSGVYIEPKAGGDPVTRPQVVPTGGNFYTVDQRRIPTEQAWSVAVDLTDQLLVDYYEKHGKWPESIGYVLWAGETTRTEGVMEAQIMYLIGVHPTWASGGNVNADIFNVIDADDIKITLNDGTVVNRPRIDVVIEISGLYRDTFPEKVLMLDRAIRLAYEQEEGTGTGTENYIKRHTDAIMDATDYSKDVALSRIFGPSSSTYGVGMDNLIASTDSWNSSADLAEQFISRMGYVYNSLGEWGTTNEKDLYTANLANIDATVHSRSSALYGALDNDDFYQYLGGLNLAVSYARDDGKYPESYVVNLQNYKLDENGNMIGGTPGLDSLSDFLSNEIYSRYTNQKWIDGMQQHGYAGANEIASVFENLWGWAATNPDLVTDRMWNDLYQTLLTGENGEWMQSDSTYSYSYQSAVARLIQAATKEDGLYWNADDLTMEQLVNDYVDSVIQNGVACCHHTCGNLGFNDFVSGYLSVPGMEAKKDAFDSLVSEATEWAPSSAPAANTSSSSSGVGQAQIIDSSVQTTDVTEEGSGYGTDTAALPGDPVTGYEMTESTIENSISDIRDFLQNPSVSSSSIVAIAFIVLVVGAIFYGFRKKD